MPKGDYQNILRGEITISFNDFYVAFGERIGERKYPKNTAAFSEIFFGKIKDKFPYIDPQQKGWIVRTTHDKYPLSIFLNHRGNAGKLCESQLSLIIVTKNNDLYDERGIGARWKVLERDVLCTCDQPEEKKPTSKKTRPTNVPEQATTKVACDCANSKQELLIRIAELEKKLENAELENDALKQKLQSMDDKRKEMNNTIIELRGNIRVFARVRPPIINEDDKMTCGWSFIDEETLEIVSQEHDAGRRQPSKYDFSFDHVFKPDTTQDEIFELVSPLVQSALDGYKICIFAYGQTGSGKTFTMDGVEGKLGIIPRTVKLLFDSINSSEILGWSYSITVSFLEIYNEVLHDLLSNKHKTMDICTTKAKSKTEIYVSNLTQIEVNTAAMLSELMATARSNRATASTIGNERSSRSHAVTRLEIVGTHPSRREKLVGFINLVDLAGSESPKTSQRMEETKSINNSLSELSNVISALVQKNVHVPYRNSKLTYLLKPCLEGNSKTLMFLNVSPFQENFRASVKSLQFGVKAKSCELGKAKR